MVVPQGSTPSDAQLQQVETYRQQFPAFFAKAATNMVLHGGLAQPLPRVAWTGLLSGKSVEFEIPEIMTVRFPVPVEKKSEALPATTEAPSEQQ